MKTKEEVIETGKQLYKEIDSHSNEYSGHIGGFFLLGAILNAYPDLKVRHHKLFEEVKELEAAGIILNEDMEGKLR